MGSQRCHATSRVEPRRSASELFPSSKPVGGQRTRMPLPLAMARPLPRPGIPSRRPSCGREFRGHREGYRGHVWISKDNGAGGQKEFRRSRRKAQHKREHCGERNITPEQMRQPGSALTASNCQATGEGGKRERDRVLSPCPPRTCTLELREVKKNFTKEFSKMEKVT